jgi:hypothetical protein
VLPDLGSGANAAHLNAAGDVVGWVGTGPAGASPLAVRALQRPALWSRGALTLLAAEGTAAAATRINAAGDVLLQLAASDRPGYGQGTSVAVRRADGTLLRVGPVRYDYADLVVNPNAFAVCCDVAGDLTDSRQVLASNASAATWPVSVRYDVATGAPVDTAPARYFRMNDRGQRLGGEQVGFSYATNLLSAAGFTPPPYPAPDAWWRTRCYPAAPSAAYRWSTAVDLDDAARAVVRVSCPSTYFVFLAASGSVWLDELLGPVVSAHLAPRGGLVAALDSAGALYLWRADTRRVDQVRLPDGRWRVDSLGAVSAQGAIAAHGVNASTGRAAALLLTPAAP